MTWVAVYWTISALVGMLIFSALLVVATSAWLHLRRTATDPANATMALLHLRMIAAIFWLMLVFFILGVVTLLPHPSESWQVWVARVVLMTPTPIFIVVGLLSWWTRTRIGQSK